MNKNISLSRQFNKKPYLIVMLVVAFLIMVVFTPGKPAKAFDNSNFIAFNTFNFFPFSLNTKQTEINSGLSQEEMNKVNIDHDPEAIKAYMQQIAPDYGVDWKLVYAIGAYESGHYKSNLAQYNNNFFGRKATSTTWMRYNSAEEGIRDQFVYIKEHYIDRGLDTPAKMNRIYCEGNSWQYKVQYIMNQL